jgi:uncharacterized alkaline shock family protein YloU
MTDAVSGEQAQSGEQSPANPLRSPGFGDEDLAPNGSPLSRPASPYGPPPVPPQPVSSFGRPPSPPSAWASAPPEGPESANGSGPLPSRLGPPDLVEGYPVGAHQSSGEPGFGLVGYERPVGYGAGRDQPRPERFGEAMERAGDLLDQAGDAMYDATGRAVEATRDAAGRVITRIRNNATLPATRGQTIIANEVVEKIAHIAAREVPGVHDLGGDVIRAVSAVRERLHLGEESRSQGVSVRLSGKNAEIDLTLVIEYGFQVFSVAEKVREKVISAVENLLGLDVTQVDITVDDVHVSDDETRTADDAARAAGYNTDTKAIVVGG